MFNDPAQILFSGAGFAQVNANRYGSKIVPDPGMVKTTEMERAEQGIPHEEFWRSWQVNKWKSI
jgi:hypothetical protein